MKSLFLEGLGRFVFNGYDPSMFKFAIGLGAGNLAAGKLIGLNHYSMTLVNVPITVFGMAMAGALMSLAWGAREKSKPILYLQVVFSAVIGTAAVMGVPHFFNIDPPKVEVQPIVGFFYGLVARWLIPLVLEVMPFVVRRYAGAPAKSEESK